MQQSTRFLLSLGAALLAGGCGATAPNRDEATIAPGPARPLVVLNRVMGESPVVDEITVGADRRVEVRRLRGAAGAGFDHFRLSEPEVAGLRGQLARLGRRGRTPAKGPRRWYYTLRLDGRRPRYYVEGREPAEARPAIRRLERLIATSSQRDPARRSR